jgi:hypothetical protein
MFLYQISILLPVGRTTSTHCMEYEAGHFGKCHNTIEELWVFTNFDPAFQPSISIHVSTTTIFSWLLKRPTHVTKWLFLQTVCSSHTNTLFIHFFLCIYYAYSFPCYIFPAKAPPPKGPETRREEHQPDKQNSQFLFVPPRRSSIRN